MSTTLMISTIAITFALIFYTIGVFGERRAKKLNKKHVKIFWMGLICDSLGTFMMGQLSKNEVNIVAEGQGIHAVTGALAIVLMLFHALWATWVLYKNDEEKKVIFHKFSITVWLIWLIPYGVGMVMGMA